MTRLVNSAHVSVADMTVLPEVREDQVSWNMKHNAMDEEARIRFLLERDGLEATITWVWRTLRMYRAGVLDKRHHGSSAEFRRGFIESYCYFKRWLARMRAYDAFIGPKENRLVDHQTLIRNEFTRQAETIDSATFFTDAGILKRIREAAALTRSTRALDVACGPGIVAEALAQDAGEVIACDITPEMLSRASRRFARAGLANVRCVPGKAEALPFDDDSFDVVFTRSSLHHFPAPALALREMVRVLRASGRAIIMDVTSSEDPEESALHNALEMLRDPSHVRMLPKSELLAHIQAAGLEVKTITGWTNHQELAAWLKIANAPERDGTLRTIMTALAKAGVRAGINLRLEDDKLLFDHHPLLVVAEKKRA